MRSDDQRTGTAPIRQRGEAANDERDDSTRLSPTEVNDLDEVTPDAVSPEVRSYSSGPVRGGMTAEDGLGAAGGRDRSGPGGRERGVGQAEDGPGRGVHSSRDD